MYQKSELNKNSQCKKTMNTCNLYVMDLKKKI